MPDAVVLLSGGLDSATTLAIAMDQGFTCHCLTVLYGQRHEVEVEAAKRVASALGAAAHKFVKVDLREFGGSALTDDIEVPKDQEDSSSVPVTYVPARNTVMLSLALAYAEVTGSCDVFIGVNAVDYSGYPDCRPEFIEAFQSLAQVATKAGVEGRRLQVHAPLVDLKKPEIVQVGLRLGVDYALTHSCYDPDALGRACGHCDSCLIRGRAFGALGLQDPALVHLGAGAP
ncbi:MAG: 7-cyano-7-deazaguanine synthase QueC [Armatimonadetes bacterium]|nr:7-cyano-7-deazaguanine synthase QueC [Armatimonadota bacterium]